MITTHSLFQFQRSALALAVAAVFIPAQAQVKPVEGSVTVGLGVVDGQAADRALFGQYNGLSKDNDIVGMLGVDYRLRTEDPARWIDFQGSNLLGDTREMNLVWKDPGRWKFTADYSELVHDELNRVNTGVVGLDTVQPQVTALSGGPGSGANVDLQTKRTKLGFGYARSISPRLDFYVDIKSENKTGSRLFGIGMNCPTANDPGCLGTTGINVGGATLMLAEPVDANHTQIEARLNYAFEKLRFNFGYYGSIYRNANSSLNPVVGGSLYNAVGTLLPVSAGLLGYLNQSVALSPDNQMHQLDLSGNYDFSPRTRGTFKLAYSRASQDDGFATASRTGASNLGAKVDSTLAQVGLTSRPLPKLTVWANLRYQDRDDQTPIAYYNLGGVTPYTNYSLSNRKVNASMQASWQFTSDYRGTLAADLESIKRDRLTATSAVSGITALRQDTDETGVRAELRRRLSDNLSGSVSLSSSRRDGSNWLRDNSGLGVSQVTDAADPSNGFSTGVFMPTLADRQRDKLKIYADWMPNKDLSIQLSAENGKDKYSSPSVYGLKDTRMNQLAVDMSYALSFRWGLNGYISHGNQTFNQSIAAGYVMAFDNTNTSFGMGFTGKPTNQLEVGGSLSYADDNSKYAQTLDRTGDAYSAATLAAAGGLPDIVFRQTALKLFGKYAMDKKSAIRLDFVHQQTKYNDWAWGYNGVSYTYSDGTTLSQKHDQTISYIGISYIHQLP